MMTLNRSNSKVVSGAVQEWRQSGLLSPETASTLLQDIAVETFDWKRLAKYSFWIAIVCIVIAVAAALADKMIIEVIERIFNSSYWLKFLGTSAVAAAIYLFGFRRRALKPLATFSNEAILFLGVLATAGAVYEFGQAIDNGSGHFSILILISCFVYAAVGWFGRSPLVWLFALVSLGGWMGAETGYASGYGAYFLGMNYPMRFTLFGAALTALALIRKDWIFERVTLVMGLLYTFIALWILSIFGNYGDMTRWYDVHQIELFHWSVLFAAASCGAIYHGLKTDSGVTKGFGLTFLFINLYTRFFEYFWNGLHKALFFAVLAVSFWYLGNHAEKIWSVGGRDENGDRRIPS